MKAPKPVFRKPRVSPAGEEPSAPEATPEVPEEVESAPEGPDAAPPAPSYAHLTRYSVRPKVKR